MGGKMEGCDEEFLSVNDEQDLFILGMMPPVRPVRRREEQEKAGGTNTKVA